MVKAVKTKVAIGTIGVLSVLGAGAGVAHAAIGTRAGAAAKPAPARHADTAVPGQQDVQQGDQNAPDPAAAPVESADPASPDTDNVQQGDQSGPDTPTG